MRVWILLQLVRTSESTRRQYVYSRGSPRRWGNTSDRYYSPGVGPKVTIQKVGFHPALHRFLLWLNDRRRLKEARQAHEQLMDFMQNQVAERKAEFRAGTTEGKQDIFTMLVKANEEEAGKFQLSNEELVSFVST